MRLTNNKVVSYAMGLPGQKLRVCTPSLSFSKRKCFKGLKIVVCYTSIAVCIVCVSVLLYGYKVNVPITEVAYSGSLNFSETESYKKAIRLGSFEPIVTLFTTWEDESKKDVLKQMTIRNWSSLRPFVIPVIMTNSTDLQKKCRRFGWKTLPVSVTAAGGVPVLKYMFRDVMEAFKSSYYAYSNGDILYTLDLINTLAGLTLSNLTKSEPLLIVGQRTNVHNLNLEEGSTWENVKKVALKRGKLFSVYAEDYFISSPNFPWMKMDDVVIGRRAYDNWLVSIARKNNFTVIDATRTILAVHQTDRAGNFEGHTHPNKDYNHLLIRKLYKNINYAAGRVDCIDILTKFENGSFRLYSRRTAEKPRFCIV